MKLRSLPFLCVALLSLILPHAAKAFDITNGVDVTLNPITKPDNSPIAAGQFTCRMGYFNFSSNLEANNAAIIANQNDLAALNANFVELFNFDPAQQAEGDTGAASTATVRNPNGEVGSLAGGPGLLYVYLLTDSAVWNAAPYNDFIGKQVYAWVQLVATPNIQAIFTSTPVFTFNPGNDPFNGATNFVVSEANPDLNVLVGNDRTATASNDYQLEGPSAGQIRLSAATYSVGEAGPSVAVTVRRTGGMGGVVSVNFSTANNTPVSAQAGQDYTAVNQTVTFPDGSMADQIVTIPILDDTIFEGNETFLVRLANPTGGATLGSPSTATVTIQENDPIPPQGTVSLTSTTFSGAEDGGSIAITARRSSGTAGAVTVQYSTSNGSAVAGTDYTATSGTLSWNDQEGGVKTFTVPVIDNTADQPNKNFMVALSNVTGGAVLIAPTTATVTIVDDDTAGAISFAAATGSVAENGGSLSVTVRRTGGADGAVSVSFATANSTPTSAQAGVDYTATNRTVTFPNGNMMPQTVLIPILDDAIFEGNETFRAMLTNPTGGATLGTPSTTTLTIVDNEIARPGSFSFSAANYTGAEAGNPVTITVTRSNGADGPASVNYSATNGTATAGSDFVATNGPLSFASGQTSRTFQVTLINDPVIEPDETVTLRLSSPTNGSTLGSRPTATLTITSEDQPPPIDQPDGLVAPRDTQAFVGNNVYNNTGNGQIAVRNGTGNSTMVFIVRVQNDSNVPDSFRVNAVASGTALDASVRYFRNGIEVTAEITQPTGLAIATIPAQSTTDIEVQVIFAGSARFTGYGTTVTITSQRTADKSDVVRALGIVNEDGVPPPEEMLRADLNTDRNSDVIWQNNVSGDRAIWLMNGAIRVGERFLPRVPTEWQIASSADFNSDGQIDLLWQNSRNGDRSIWLMNGTNRVGEHFLPRIHTDWQIASTGDFDGDRKVDILWQNNRNGDRAVWLMNGTNRVGERFLPRVPTDWQIAGASDFSGDQHVDILWQNRVTGERTFWLMNGTDRVGERYLPTIPTDWQMTGTGDFSNDRKTDILWQNRSTGQRTIWLMNGLNRAGERILPTIPTQWQVRNQ